MKVNKFVFPLAQVRPSDRQVGAKARVLARLLRRQFAVPKGFVLRHDVWLFYLAANDASGYWQAFLTQPDESHARPLRDLLTTTALHEPLRLALTSGFERYIVDTTAARSAHDETRLCVVRSAFGGEDGGEHSFAGIFESKLGVGAEGLDAAVRAVWASAFSQRACAYYALAAPPSALSLLVQVVPTIDCAGVAFSLDPEDPDALAVNAVWGLGEPLVQGRVRPDRWSIARFDGQVLRHERGERAQAAWMVADGLEQRALEPWAPAPLSDARLADLRRLTLRLEKLLGGPQDIEWLHDGLRFWVVQARPITARSSQQIAAVWTAANFREIYPDLPSPLALSMILAGQERAFRYYTSLEPRLQAQPFIAAFEGRPFFNLSLLVAMVAGWGLPASFVTDAVGGEVVGTPLDRPQYRRIHLARLLAALPALLRLQVRHLFVLPRAWRTIGWMRQQARTLDALPLSAPEHQLRPLVALHSETWSRVVAESLNVTGALSKPLFLLRLLLPPDQRHALGGAPSISTQLAHDLRATAEYARQASTLR